MAKYIDHPIKHGQWPVQNVLLDLAGQENCDGEPYDQMVAAADYINDLEKENKILREEISAFRSQFPGVRNESSG